MLRPRPRWTDLQSHGPPVKSLLNEVKRWHSSLAVVTSEQIKAGFLSAERAQEGFGGEPDSGSRAARTACQPWFLRFFFFSCWDRKWREALNTLLQQAAVLRELSVSRPGTSECWLLCGRLLKTNSVRGVRLRRGAAEDAGAAAEVKVWLWSSCQFPKHGLLTIPSYLFRLESFQTWGNFMTSPDSKLHPINKVLASHLLFLHPI